MKNNPLFVDSTKFRGERIVAEIEVRGVQLREKESLFTKIIFQDGRNQLLRLEQKSPQRYSGTIRLAYQEDLHFQHQIQIEEEVVDRTEERKFVSNYTVLDKWIRIVEELRDQYVEEVSFDDLERALKSEAMNKKLAEVEETALTAQDAVTVEENKEEEVVALFSKNLASSNQTEAVLDAMETELSSEQSKSTIDIAREKSFAPEEESEDTEKPIEREAPDEILEMQTKLKVLLESQVEQRERRGKSPSGWTQPIPNLKNQDVEVEDIKETFVDKAEIPSLQELGLDSEIEFGKK